MFDRSTTKFTVCREICASNRSLRSIEHQFHSFILFYFQLNSSPYFNEPGYTPGPHHDALAKSYTERVEYDTLRVAVLGMIKDTYMDAKNLPQYLKDIVHKRFVEQYDLYMKIIRANISKPSIPFNYSHLKQEFEKLKVEMANKPTAKPIPKPTAKPTAKK